MLCSVDWYLVTDVSGQLIGLIFKGLHGTTSLRCITYQKGADLIYSKVKQAGILYTTSRRVQTVCLFIVHSVVPSF